MGTLYSLRKGKSFLCYPDTNIWQVIAEGRGFWMKRNTAELHTKCFINICDAPNCFYRPWSSFNASIGSITTRQHYFLHKPQSTEANLEMRFQVHQEGKRDGLKNPFLVQRMFNLLKFYYLQKRQSRLLQFTFKLGITPVSVRRHIFIFILEPLAS